MVGRADSKHSLRELPGRNVAGSFHMEAEIILYMNEKQSWYVRKQTVCSNEEAGFGFTPCSYLKAIEKCKS